MGAAVGRRGACCSWCPGELWRVGKRRSPYRGRCAGEILLLEILQKGAGSHNRLGRIHRRCYFNSSTTPPHNAIPTSDVDLFHICHFPSRPTQRSRGEPTNECMVSALIILMYNSSQSRRLLMSGSTGCGIQNGQHTSTINVLMPTRMSCI